MYITDNYDVVVIGAGHAGVEAALAAARLGGRTLLATLSLDNIALMPCNPSVGGPAKGHLVREIDALGGQMGLTADEACIQMRLLNTGKGYAVHALRAQADKPFYHTLMKQVVENQENLDVKQLMIDRLLVENGAVVGVEAETGEVFEAKCVSLATGTYLRGRIVYGQVNYESGPNGLRSANKLSSSLLENGVELMRFKTGPPTRSHARSLDSRRLEAQYGDEQVRNFSFMSTITQRKQIPCWLTYTNADTHKIIRDNLHLSGMFNGMIEGVGPRYCPSIEAKMVRFADKERHQLFVEPEGLRTNEMYVQGMSSSVPAHVQLQFMQTIPGLENCRMMRAGYAIDYDCLDPLQLQRTLEHKAISGLFSAGQANGTSGYEEAAAQGLLAGVNAMQKIRSKEPLILRRSEGYLGVLIDDLVTKKNREPYRMMTSRAEYRLLLRQDNADLRLTEKGYEVGLISKERYDYVCKKKELIDKEIERVSHVNIGARADVQEILKKYNSIELSNGTTLEELIRRPELDYDKLAPIDPDRPKLSDDTREQINILIKYAGYISRQIKQVSHFKKLEKKLLPTDFVYNTISGLRIEAQQKLNEFQPLSIGQASRISGVTPADISVLLVFLEQLKYSNPDLLARINPNNTSVEQ